MTCVPSDVILTGIPYVCTLTDMLPLNLLLLNKLNSLNHALYLSKFGNLDLLLLFYTPGSVHTHISIKGTLFESCLKILVDSLTDSIGVIVFKFSLTVFTD